ncbi:MAG: Crp/Fnr family transcriptional regulator [Ornithinimicrobium sp.]|uniref:Crp/Fnr family transcriptional regulator n=1 Tax=Ornithinimicrobium sp. TaxID=1977084 RepID=UPI003D9B53DE
MEGQGAAKCFPERVEALAPREMPVWATGGWDGVDAMTDQGGAPSWCMAEVDIFQDLSEAEMDAMSRAAPMRRYAAGELLHTPHQQVEALFILKQGRVRVFRLSPDGRALTTAVLSPGTIFGEMVVVGQQMYDSYAEALEDVVVCSMDRADVHRFLLGDARIAARIAETLGRRLARIESQWSDAVFKSVPQRVAGALAVVSERRGPLPLGRATQVNLTHEQVAGLAGTSRETATRILGDYAREGLIDLGRGRIKILDPDGLARASGG